jgi:hypothetical protein
MGSEEVDEPETICDKGWLLGRHVPRSGHGRYRDAPMWKSMQGEEAHQMKVARIIFSRGALSKNQIRLVQGIIVAC